MTSASSATLRFQIDTHPSVHLRKRKPGIKPFVAGDPARSRQLLLRLFRHVHFGAADIFDFNGCSPFNVPVVAVEAYSPFELVFVLGQRAVF